MEIRHLLITSILSLSVAACGGKGTESNLAPAEISESLDSLIFDISGIKVGMTQDQVTDAAAQSGYHPKNRSGSKSNILAGLSYEELIKKRQGLKVSNFHLHQKGLGAMSFQKNEKELLEVNFTAFPNGPRVTSVNYSLKDSTMSPEQFRDIVLQRYNIKTNENKRLADHSWSGARSFAVDGILVHEQLSITSMREAGQLGLAENNLGLTGNIDQKSYNAALDAAIPKSESKTSF